MVAAIRRVAERLGNTPAVCRKCYVHPAVIEAYMDRALARAPARAPAPEEAAVLALLSRRGAPLQWGR